MKKKDRKRHVWLTILLGFIFFLWACSQTIEPAISQESKIKESSMSTDLEKNTPSIDTAVPFIFETASFGLG